MIVYSYFILIFFSSLGLVQMRNAITLHENRIDKMMMLLRANQRLVQKINALTDSKWTVLIAKYTKAQINLFPLKAYNYEQIALMNSAEKKKLLGVVPEEGRHEEFLRMPKKRIKSMASLKENNLNITCTLVDEFDGRTEWPICAEIIGSIQDQAGCGSCWAVAVASAFTDRLCIQRAKMAKGEFWPRFGPDQHVQPDRSAYNWRSALDLISCSRGTGFGCNGGWPEKAWDWIVKEGIATGSNYTMKAGCKPYPFLPYNYKREQTPECSDHCENTKWTTSEWISENQKSLKFDRKYRGRASAFVSLNGGKNEKAMMDEMRANGSIVVTFIVYSDFFSYKSGVYKVTNGYWSGFHAVRLIGWGTQRCTDGSQQKYWLAANSWNTWWGDNGLFRIARGEDECRIESWGISFGIPTVRADIKSIRYFLRPNSTWLNSIREEMGFDSDNETAGNDETTKKLFRNAEPNKTKQFDHDGFKPFKALSLLLTGTPDNHIYVSQQIQIFLNNNKELAEKLLAIYSDQANNSFN